MNDKTTQPREQAAKLQRFNMRGGLMNPETWGLYVRYEDVAALFDTVAAPEAPTLIAGIHWSPSAGQWALTVYADLPKVASATYKLYAPLVPEVAASEACVHCKRLPGDPEGMCDWIECPVGYITPAATTVCTPNCFYGDCPPCVEAGLVPAEATTASASGEGRPEGWRPDCVGQGISTSPVPPDGDDTCSACNGTGRAALTQQSAAQAPLAHGHRDDYYLLANARRVGLMPIHQIVRMPNWVLASELFATGSTSANQICRDAGIDPDSYKVDRAAMSAATEQGEKP